jgi:hypothetical protein
LNAARLSTLPLRVTLPLTSLKAGKYECQLNVIDEFGRKFAFPRMSIAVLPGK